MPLGNYVTRKQMVEAAGHTTRDDQVKCEQAWTHLSHAHSITGVNMDRTKIEEAGVLLGLNAGNIRTEYLYWRDAQELHGIKNLPASTRRGENVWREKAMAPKNDEVA
jgi:hypothetical protein